MHLTKLNTNTNSRFKKVEPRLLKQFEQFSFTAFFENSIGKYYLICIISQVHDRQQSYLLQDYCRDYTFSERNPLPFKNVSFSDSYRIRTPLSYKHGRKEILYK